MKSEVKKLSDGLSSTVDAYVSLDVTDAGKVKALNILSKEVEIIKGFEEAKSKQKIDVKKLKLEKEKIDNQAKVDQEKLKLDNKKFELDQRKVENENLREEKKLELEKWKLEIDAKKVEVESQKVINDDNNKKLEAKNAKTEKIMNICLRVFEIGVPLAINAGLVMVGFRLVYKDDGRVPSEMRDLMRNIL